MADDIFIYPLFDHSRNQLESLPARFRIGYHPLNQDEASPHFKGLESLMMSGSGQFSEKNFFEMMRRIPVSQVAIVDLRQESHGFINGRAIGWVDGHENSANRDKSLEEIEQDERQRIQQALQAGVLILNPHRHPKEINVDTAQTEKQFVTSLGLQYKRLPILDHHPPSDLIVGEFINWIKHVPAGTWIHFHCRAGRGRSTLLMTMYDILMNAQSCRLEDILYRQKLLGGNDLSAIYPTDHVRHLSSMKRLEFIKRFYEQCRQSSFNS